jgi:hypothetical protein
MRESTKQPDTEVELSIIAETSDSMGGLQTLDRLDRLDTKVAIAEWNARNLTLRMNYTMSLRQQLSTENNMHFIKSLEEREHTYENVSFNLQSATVQCTITYNENTICPKSEP